MALRIRVPAFPPTTIYAILRPSSDVSDGLWTTQAGGTALSTVLDETVRDDTDYARSDTATLNDVFEVHLSDPASTFQNGTLKIVIGKETNNSDVVDFFVELRQGSTTIASWVYADVAYGAVMKTERLTDAQFAAITDFTDLRVRVTAGQMPLWTPADLAVAPIVWMDAQDAGSITHASGAVSSVTNKGSLGGSFAQGTAINRPTYSTTGFDGTRPGIVFDAADPNALDIAWSHTGSSIAAFAVFDGDTSGSTYGRIISASSGANDDWGSVSRFALAEQNPTNFLFSRNGDTLITKTTGAHLGGLVSNSTSNSLRLDGGTASTGGSVGNFGFTLLRIGCRANNLTPNEEAFAGKIGEIVLLNYEPTTAEREQIEGYLAHRWGIQSKLPGGHPYKSVAPAAPFVGD